MEECSEQDTLGASSYIPPRGGDRITSRIWTRVPLVLRTAYISLRHDRRRQEPGTLGIARTRQSGSDKLAGFRTRNGSFLHAHLASLRRHRSPCRGTIYHQAAAILHVPRAARMWFTVRARSPSLRYRGHTPIHRTHFSKRGAASCYGCVRTCVCTRARRGPRPERTLLVPRSGFAESGGRGRGGQGFLNRATSTITQALPRLIIRVYSAEVARRSAVRTVRSGTERRRDETRSAGRQREESEERMAGRLWGTARTLAVCLVYLLTLFGELPPASYRSSPCLSCSAPTLSVPSLPLAPWPLVPLSLRQSHSLKNAPYEPAGTWRSIEVRWSTAASVNFTVNSVTFLAGREKPKILNNLFIASVMKVARVCLFRTLNICCARIFFFFFAKINPASRCKNIYLWTLSPYLENDK